MTRVEIDNTFSVEVPDDLEYSLERENNGPFIFSMIELDDIVEMNATAAEVSPFAIPDSLPIGIGIRPSMGKIVPKTTKDTSSETKKKIVTLIHKGADEATGESESSESDVTILEYDDPELLSSYSFRKSEGGFNMIGLFIDYSVYIGMFSVDGIEGKAKQIEFIETFLKSIKRI